MLHCEIGAGLQIQKKQTAEMLIRYCKSKQNLEIILLSSVLQAIPEWGCPFGFRKARGWEENSKEQENDHSILASSSINISLPCLHNTLNLGF